MQRVLVVDHAGFAVGDLRPAEARQLVKSGVAVFDDGKLKLATGVQDPHVSSGATGESVMSTLRSSLSTLRNNNTDLAALFAAGEKPIWLRNKSPIQWSLSIDVPNGDPIPFRLYNTHDPVCITDEIPWDVLKQSVEFKRFSSKLINGKPVVEFLTEAEAEAHYQSVAAAHKLANARAAYDKALERRKNARKLPESVDKFTREEDGSYKFSPPKTMQDIMDLQDGKAPKNLGAAVAVQGAVQVAQTADGPVAASGGLVRRIEGVRSQEEMGNRIPSQTAAPVALSSVSPRVMNLCAQASPQTPQDLRLPGEAFIREIVSMGDTLTVEELRYIQDHAVYGSVVSWAKRKQEERERARVVEDPYASLIEELEQPARAAPPALKE